MFGLTQIPQVVMNIDYTLEPITDENVAAYFHDWDLNSYVKLLYHFKNISSLRIFLREMKYICKDLFIVSSYFVK